MCDFGGVLTTPLAGAFAAYHEVSGIPSGDLQRAIERAEEHGGAHPLFELEKGRISEREFLDRLSAHLGVGVTLDGFREVYFEHLHPNPPMIERMREAREAGLRTALLTNNVREWEPLWRSKIPDVEEIFEVIVDSGFVGMRKPERGIYELTLERIDGGVPATDCLFVDDVEVNCDAARELGMGVVHFRENRQALAEIDAVLR
ncbi:MAG: HAD family phosphatase [Thermoleophilaceae bacterium]